jgi:hypothetical protein
VRDSPIKAFKLYRRSLSDVTPLQYLTDFTNNLAV